MSDRFDQVKASIDDYIDRVKEYWASLSTGSRIGVGVYCLAVVIFASIILLRRPRAVEEVKPVVEVAAPTVSAPEPIPQKIVIDSVDQATFADAFDDDSTEVKIRSDVAQPEMLRVANNWLAPQVIQLETQIKAFRRSIDRDRKYLEQNQPQIATVRAELEQAEKDYKRANAALDLPSLPDSSFSREVETRFQEAKARLDKLRKRLKTLEDGVAAAQRRLSNDEDTLPQIEVEAANLRDRLKLVRSLDAKILPITYQYAVSGLTSLPLLRFTGRGTWDPVVIKDVQLAFERRFRYTLPISALGQSDTHDRLGWDHRHAADVAVNPASSEGQWLISYLRDRNIPFMAFRAALRGISTGPHVHIGLPSQRLRR